MSRLSAEREAELDNGLDDEELSESLDDESLAIAYHRAAIEYRGEMLELRAELAEAKASNGTLREKLLQESIAHDGVVERLGEQDAELRARNVQLLEELAECKRLNDEQVHALIASANEKMMELIQSRIVWEERHDGPCGLVECEEMGSHSHRCGVAKAAGKEGA